MVKLTEALLAEIAEKLDSGFACYLHKETGTLVSFPDPLRFDTMEFADWEEAVDLVEENPSAYREIHSMPSRESFLVMQEFVENEVSDREVQARLIQALEGRKPFANFKQQVHNSGSFRELWFAFHKKKLMDWVVSQME